jgi:hypothetical protein
MDILLLALRIVVFLVSAAASVILAWWSWHRTSDHLPPYGWRLRVTFYGVIAASVGFFLELAFLIREYAFSYVAADSVPLGRVAAWGAVLTWLVALFAAIFGRGKERWFLMLYVVVSILGILFFVGMMD